MPGPSHIATAPVSDIPDLAFRSPSPEVFSWIKDGHGLIAWGEYATARFTGADSLHAGDTWFAEQTADAVIDDKVRRPGTGALAFVSGAFDPDRATTSFVIPRHILGRDEFGSWMTTIGDGGDGNDGLADLPPHRCADDPGLITYGDGHLDPADWMEAVAEAVRRIRAGRLDKVVLARDIMAFTERPIDPRFLIQRLTSAYHSCWTYSVHGLIGATPELLLRLRDGRVYSRVLAGTEWGEGAYERVQSPKNREEHAYAARSAAASLEKVTIRLDVPREPTVLTLPNVVHLATEIHGDVAEGIGACQVAAAMHPTAAVGGSPTDLAVATITELEGQDRGRYAGPVGWVDGAGNGEFGIALRGGQQRDARTMQLFAGCGIVADSDPATELAESMSKLVVMRDALEPHAG